MIDLYRALTGVPAGARPPKLTVTDIEWCRDLVTGQRGYSWNFVDGCEWASPGCDNCYAKDIATRFAGGPVFPNGFDLTLHTERLAAPLYQRRGARIFVNSMSDVGLSGIPVDLLARAFAVMALAHWHTFLIATKRPGVLRSRLSRPDFVAAVRAHVAAVDPDHAVQWPLPNVHVGVSVENQAHAWRVLELLHVPAAVHWASAEPLIGPLNLRAVRRRRDNLLVDCLAGEVRDPTGAEVVAAMPAALRWVVIGGESGHRRGVRPMHPAWVDTILTDCAALDVAAFFKQWGVHGLTPANTGAADPARDLRATRLVALDGRWCTGVEWARVATHPTKVSDAVRELWNGHHGGDSTAQVRPMYRVGRQEAGRLVRGQLVEAYPEGRHG